MNFKNLRLVKNKNQVKDPVRFPKVINGFENQSKRDFKDNLELTTKHVISEMDKMTV